MLLPGELEASPLPPGPLPPSSAHSGPRDSGHEMHQKTSLFSDFGLGGVWPLGAIRPETGGWGDPEMGSLPAGSP